MNETKNFFKIFEIKKLKQNFIEQEMLFIKIN